MTSDAINAMSELVECFVKKFETLKPRFTVRQLAALKLVAAALAQEALDSIKDFDTGRSKPGDRN